ncbi:hypothetical protein D6774_01295 [Candidatus Woesearchaeota archaeon]|nr:MAG: hypothetical protein D6774_01295 [Candidatus Woesearchaeota archaeon]
MKKLLALCTLMSACSTPIEQSQDALEDYVDTVTQHHLNVDEAASLIYALQVSQAVTQETAKRYLPITAISRLEIHETIGGVYTAVELKEGFNKNNTLPCKQYGSHPVCANEEAVLGAAQHILRKNATQAYEKTSSTIKRLGLRLKGAYEGLQEGMRRYEQ